MAALQAKLDAAHERIEELTDEVRRFWGFGFRVWGFGFGGLGVWGLGV